MDEVHDCEKWTRQRVISDLVSHLGWPQEIYNVEWIQDTVYGDSDTLIRVTPWTEYGEVVRLALKSRFDEAEASAFDKRFEEDEPGENDAQDSSSGPEGPHAFHELVGAVGP